MSEPAETEYVQRPLALDDTSLTARTQHYPDGVREGARWLGIHCRTHHNGSVKLLAAQVNSLGFKTTDGTLSKILRGYFQTDTQGQQTAAPIMKEKTFEQMLKAVRASLRRAELVGKIPFIATPTAQEIFDYISVRRADEAVCKFGLIYGPTGAQKTSSAREYCRRDESLTCIHMECPAKPNGGEFLSKLCGKFGHPESGAARFHRAKLRETITKNTCMIFDNIQKIYKPNGFAAELWEQPIFNWLQEVQDETDCTVIMLATVDFGQKVRQGIAGKYLEQFEGRCGGDIMELSEFATPGDIETIMAAFKLEGPRAHKLLAEISQQRGRIRVLFHALQKAARMANGARLTLDLIREAANKPDDKELKEAA